MSPEKDTPAAARKRVEAFLKRLPRAGAEVAEVARSLQDRREERLRKGADRLAARLGPDDPLAAEAARAVAAAPPPAPRPTAAKGAKKAAGRKAAAKKRKGGR